MKVHGKIPQLIQDKALNLLTEYRKGELHPRKLNIGGYCISVGYRYRLFSSNRREWQLMSHERYNSLAYHTRR